MRLKRAALFAGAVFSATTLSLTTATSASAATAGHLWNATNSTNKCLAIAGNHQEDHAIMWTCDAEIGQNWTISNDGDGTVEVLNGGGEILGANAGNGAWVGTGLGYTYWNWYIPVYEGNGYYELEDSNDKKRCLSIAGGSGANGANAIEWTCQATPDQLWHANGGWN
jgi:hypothetical protein